MLQMRASMACHRDPALGEMYALVRSQELLESRLRALAHQVSDANLQQMPDFQQRVEVLRQLEYTALDNTVQLKVAVTKLCMVSNTCNTCDTRHGLYSLMSPNTACCCDTWLCCPTVSACWGTDHG